MISGIDHLLTGMVGGSVGLTMVGGGGGGHVAVGGHVGVAVGCIDHVVIVAVIGLYDDTVMFGYYMYMHVDREYHVPSTKTVH